MKLIELAEPCLDTTNIRVYDGNEGLIAIYDGRESIPEVYNERTVLKIGTEKRNGKAWLSIYVQ